jgi:hypothetical protein
MDVFDAPEKRADGSYMLRFLKPIDFGTELRWEKDAEFPTPDLRIQSQLNAFREKTVKDLSLNKVMFRTPPTLASLTAITPMWGILIRGDKAEWSRQDLWTKPPVKDHALVISLVAQGVVISRQSILPVWGVKVIKALPDAHIIDLDFGSGSSDSDEGASVHSEDLASEEGVVALKDPGERKRQMKAYVRGLLEKVAQAKMEADDAMDRFFSEFDLSEDESDFSDYEDD